MNACRERAHLFKAFFLMLKKGCAADRGESIAPAKGFVLGEA